MKNLVIFLIFIHTNLFAQYNIIYKGFNIGIIDDFNNLKNGYFIAKPTNVLAKAAIGFNKQIVFHQKNKKPIFKDTFYKVDKLSITEVLHTSLLQPKEIVKNYPNNKNLTIKCDIKDFCSWIFTKNKNVIREGILTFNNNGHIKEFSDLKNKIFIKKTIK